MTGPPPIPELPDDWIVALHEALGADTHADLLTAPQFPHIDQVAPVRACLSMLEELRQINLASGGMVRHLIENSNDVADSRDVETTRIGRFEIIEELGRGGHGIVLLAYDPTLKRQVALKVPRPEVLSSREMRERFVREANAAARLTHPAIVQIYELDDSGPVCYIAAEFCPGQTLAAALRQSGPRFDSQFAARVMLSLADAVDYANSRGVLHRDLKPANVLLVPVEIRLTLTNSETETKATEFEPKLTDFGLAKLVDAEADYTRTGVLLGTPAYMAPEQAGGRLREIGVATDVYGLGTILYEMLAARPPFVGASDLEILRQVAEDDPTPLTRIRPGLSPDLAAICHKCLEKDPAARYSTAAELASDLRHFLAGEPTTARPATTLQRTGKWIRRYPMAAALIGVSTAALLLISIGGWVAYDRTRLARDEANLRRAEAERSTAQALASKRHSERLSYASVMSAAWLAWEHDDYEDACRRLEQFLPTPDQDDLREFSWYHLWNLTHQHQQVLTGHTGAIYRVRHSSDGKWLVSGGADKTARVWNAESGHLEQTLAGHSGDVNEVAISPDGETVASASDDGSVCVWNRGTGERKATLTGHGGGAVWGLAFSPDGDTLASGGADARIVLWNTEDWSERCALVHHGADVVFLAYSPDGSLLASASDDRTVKLWTNQTNDLVVTLRPKDNGQVNCLDFSRDGHFLVTGGLGDERVRLWNLDSHQELRDVTKTQDWVYSVAFCDHDRQVAVATKDGRLELVNLKDGTSRKRLGHVGRVWCVSVARDDTQLATAGADGTIKTWSLAGDQPERVIANRTMLNAAAYAADGTLVCGGYDPFSVQLLKPGASSQVETVGAGRSFTADMDADGVDDRVWFHDGKWSIESGISPILAIREIAFGQPGDVPILGDWNADDVPDLGVFRQGRFILRTQTALGEGFFETALGDATSVPLVADWNGDGRDEVGVIHNDQVLIDLERTGTPAELQATLPATGKLPQLAALPRPGQLDPTFGNAGVVMPKFTSITQGIAVAVQSAGDIVAAFNRASGTPTGPAAGNAVIRLTAAGDVDTGFHSEDIGHVPPGTFAYCADAVVQRDNKIVCVTSFHHEGRTVITLLRREADGRVDTTFGPHGDGSVIVNFGEGEIRPFRLAVRPDGSIVVVGTSPKADQRYSQWAVASFTPDGKPDTGFGSDKSGVVYVALGQHSDQARCVCPLPDGRIVVAGNMWDLNRTYVGLVRYHRDGSLDESFGTGGKVVVAPPEALACAMDLAITRQGDLIVVGNASRGRTYAMLAKFNFRGELDPTFGSLGWVLMPLRPEGGIWTAFTRVAIDRRGRIVVAGMSGNETTGRTLLFRFLKNGTCETDFRSALSAHPQVGTGHYTATGLTVDENDRPIIAGDAKTEHFYNLMVGRFQVETAPNNSPPVPDQDYSSLELDRIQRLLTPELIQSARVRATAKDWPQPQAIDRLAVSPAGNVIATYTAPDSFVRILETSTGRELAVLSGHPDEVLSIAFSPDGRRLATAGHDSFVKIWDTSMWHELAALAGHAQPVRRVSFSSDGQRLACGDKTGVRVWGLNDQRLVRNTVVHDDSHCLAFSGDIRIMAAQGPDRLIKLWDVATGRLLATLTGHTGTVRSAAFSPDKRTLASCGVDGTVRLWDLRAYQVLAVQAERQAAVNGVIFSPDGHELLSVGSAADGRGEMRIRSMRIATVAE